MNILYCGDKNIADGLIISVLSLLNNTTEQLNIYILTVNLKGKSRAYEALPNELAEFLDAKAREYNPHNSVTLINIEELFNAEPPTANLDTRFTPCCMLRLYADLVVELPERLLYLDNDVICRTDPQQFYNRNIDGTELVGVLDHYGKWFFRQKPWRADYLNSGVLLLNLKEIRSSGLFAKCRQLCRTKKMFMPDQSAINKLCTRKSFAPRRYNEQRRLHCNTVFQHFTTSFRFLPWFHAVSVKPWNIDGMHSTLKLHEYDTLIGQYIDAKEDYKRSFPQCKTM